MKEGATIVKRSFGENTAHILGTKQNIAEHQGRKKHPHHY